MLILRIISIIIALSIKHITSIILSFPSNAIICRSSSKIIECSIDCSSIFSKPLARLDIRYENSAYFTLIRRPTRWLWGDLGIDLCGSTDEIYLDGFYECYTEGLTEFCRDTFLLNVLGDGEETKPADYTVSSYAGPRSILIPDILYF